MPRNRLLQNIASTVWTRYNKYNLCNGLKTLHKCNMEYYKLRIDLKILVLKQVTTFLDVHSTDKYAYCIEGGEVNPHVHCYFATQVKNATLRKHLRELGLSGNGGYSLKQCEEDPVEYLAYMMKEREYDFSHLPPDLVKLVKAHNDEVKKGMKEKKAKKKTILQGIEELLDERYEFSDQEVQLAILNYHLENNLLVRKFQLQSYYDTIMLRRKGAMSSLHLFN